jgi:hypothetical protein
MHCNSRSASSQIFVVNPTGIGRRGTEAQRQGIHRSNSFNSSGISSRNTAIKSDTSSHLLGMKAATPPGHTFRARQRNFFQAWFAFPPAGSTEHRAKLLGNDRPQPLVTARGDFKNDYPQNYCGGCRCRRALRAVFGRFWTRSRSRRHRLLFIVPH